MSRLDRDFYTRPNVVEVAQDLLGKYLFSASEQGLTAGKIVETEAYCGRNDKACHAYNNRRTARTETMYAEGGSTYVYLCYGIHALFNVVTNAAETADAVLIRALEPKIGLELIKKRRKMDKVSPRLTAGPGILTKALDIRLEHDNLDLVNSERLWIEDKKEIIRKEEILASPRVGIAYAEEDADLPWRFRLKNSRWCSPAK